MAKLWAGRFGKETDLEVNDFNSSISFDCRLYKEDITGSMAHAAMLGKQGIIAKEESDKIIEGLKGILADIEAGKIHFSQDYEDIHMNVEQILTERIGDAGKRLHTARSRNDQVALDMRLYVKKEIVAIKKEILDFMEALCESAKNNLETVMPGYTHLQRAQPVTFGHYMMAYANMMRRDVIRLENCLEGMDDMPLGSGALASTTYPIDRDFVRQQLGRVLTPMFSTMQILKDNMKKAALKGFINATDCADYLTKKGMPFRDAYKTVGQLVAQCVREDKSLADLTLEEYKTHSDVFENDVYEAIDLKTCVRGRKVIGGPAPEEVTRQISVIEKFVSEHKVQE